MDINQVYKAPSIPKLGKKTVSSSVLRGASTTTAVPRLNQTRFTFLKPKISADNLKTEASSVSVEQSLAETNRILVEIQKQLSLDFANRIAEEKDILDKTKKAESKRKFSLKEKSVEGVRKIGEVAGGISSKIIAPTLSIFDKIKEFFSIILTSIIATKAFAWLQEEENRQKLDRIFEFVGKYWKEIAGILIGIKLATTIASLWGTIALIGGILASPAFIATAAVVATIASLTKLTNLQGDAMQRTIDKKEKEKGAPLTEKEKINASIETITRFPLNPIFGSMVEEQIQKREARDREAAKNSKAKGGTIYNFNPTAIQKFSSGDSVRGYAEGGTFWERLTGTVGGIGSGMIDSVRAMLAPGEEIINTRSAMLFRPLLKDLNDNAGRKWVEFSMAIRKLFSVTERQKKTAEEFAKVLEDFNRYIEDDIQKKKTSGVPPQGGGIGGMATTIRPSSSEKKQISAAPRITNFIMNSSPTGGMNFLPMVLPTQKSKPPQMPQMKTKANEVVAISPIDVTNPWMEVTSEWYGIQMYG